MARIRSDSGTYSLPLYAGNNALESLSVQVRQLTVLPGGYTSIYFISFSFDRHTYNGFL